MTPEYVAWLSDRNSNVFRNILVEVDVQVGGVEVTRYMAVRGYTTLGTDTPANTVYMPILEPGLQFTESLSISPGGQASLSYGDVEVQNPSGERDSWRQDVWRNRRIRAWSGDMRWPRAKYELIFDGIVDDLAPKGRDKFSLKLRDKSQRLNTPVTDHKLGGTSANADTLVPVALGEIHNGTPLFSSEALQEFVLHDGQMAGDVEIRTNGAPVTSITTDLATGRVKLNLAYAGTTVTASFRGDMAGGVYSSTVAQCVQRLVTGYGKASERLQPAELDTANLAAFNTACPQPVGIYLTDRTNVLNAVQALTVSVGAQMSMSRLGQMRLLRIDLPPTGTPTEIQPYDMVMHTLVPTSYTPVVGAVLLGYNKNWTVQSNLQTSIPSAHAALFAKEWSTSTKTAPAVQATYRLDAEPEQADTMLLRAVDADAEAQRQLNIWSKPHTVYEFEGYPRMQVLELGQTIKVFHPRYGMAAGVLGQVTSLSINWSTGNVKVGFIV